MKKSKEQDEKLLRLLFRTAGSARRRREEKAPRRRKGFGQYLDLLHGEKLTQKEIAERLSVRPQSVSETVRILEERGLVVKEKCPEDRRAHRISITPAGERHREEARRDREENAAHFFARLQEEEKETLRRLLEKLAFEEEGGAK